VIAVLDTPYFRGDRQSGRIRDCKCTARRVSASRVHERAAEETLDSLTHKIMVETAALELPRCRSSEEAATCRLPHKNKYGKDYPPVVDNQPAYPGER